jgi:metal-responsive CopG/Arc/MetJ family transcriptional regulator
MAISTVNISFQKKLLEQIDKLATNEARTRSELIREAVRMYIERKKEWEDLFQTGERIGSILEIQEKDVLREIRAHKKSNPKAK